MNLDRVIAVRNDRTVFRDGDRCIKVFGVGYSKAEVFSEALNQARAEELGLPVPALFEVTTIEGKWAILSEYIRGKTLAQLIEENPERTSEYIDRLVDLQTRVHEKTCLHLVTLTEKMRQKITAAPLHAATRADLCRRLDAMETQTALCHGDFVPSNIIIAEDGTPYILDWANAGCGSPAADAARSYLLFRLRDGEAPAERYLDSFSQKTGVESACIRRWIPLVAAASLSRGNERERAALMRHIPTLETR